MVKKIVIGILLYSVSLIIQYFRSENEYYSIAVYFMLQNLGLAIICLCGFKQKLAYRLVLVSAFTYFSSAFVFYSYALVTKKLIYFSDCGEAGLVLQWLMFIAIVLTLINAWLRGK